MEDNSTAAESYTPADANESASEDVQLYQVHYGAVYVVICVIALSIIGNGLLITAFIRDHRLQVLFNMFVINLAVADIIMSLVIMVEVFNISAYLFIFRDAKMLCQMFAVTANAIPTEQLIIAHLMCNDRHKALQHRLAYNRRFNRWHTETLKMVLTWAFSFTASFFVTDILSTLKKRDSLMCMFPDRPLFISKMAYMHGALLLVLFLALAFVIRDFRRQRRKRPYFIRLLNLEPDLEPGCSVDDDLGNRTSLQCLVPRSPCQVFGHEEFEMTPLPRAKPARSHDPASPIVDRFKTIVASRPQSVLPRPLSGGAANPSGSSPLSLRLFSFRSLTPASRAKAYDCAFKDWIQMEDLQEHEQWENIEKKYQRLQMDAPDDSGQFKVQGAEFQMEHLDGGRLQEFDTVNESASFVRRRTQDAGKVGKGSGVAAQQICGGDKRNARPIVRKSAILDRCRSENRKSVRIMMSDLSRTEGSQKSLECDVRGGDFDGSSYSQDDGSQSSCSLSEDEPTDFPVPRFKPRTDSLYTLRSCMSISEESTNLATSELKDSSTHSDNSDVMENADLRSPTMALTPDDSAGVFGGCLETNHRFNTGPMKTISDVPISFGSTASDVGRQREIIGFEPRAERSDASVYLNVSSVECGRGYDALVSPTGETCPKLKHAIGSLQMLSNEYSHPHKQDTDGHAKPTCLSRDAGLDQDTVLTQDTRVPKNTERSEDTPGRTPPRVDHPIRRGGTNLNNNYDEVMKGAEKTPDLQGCTNFREFPELDHAGNTCILLDPYADQNAKSRHSEEVDNINNSAGRKDVQDNRASKGNLEPRQKLGGGVLTGYGSEVNPGDAQNEILSQSIPVLEIDHAARDWISFYNVRCAPNTTGRCVTKAGDQRGDFHVPTTSKDRVDCGIYRRVERLGGPHVSDSDCIVEVPALYDDREIKTRIDDWVSLGSLKNPYFNAGNAFKWEAENIFDTCHQQDVERAIEGWIEFYDINGPHPCPSETSDGKMSPRLSVSEKDVGKHGWTAEYLKMVGELWRESFENVGEDNHAQRTNCGSKVGYFVSVDIDVHTGFNDASVGSVNAKQSAVPLQETVHDNTTEGADGEEFKFADDLSMQRDWEIPTINQEETTAERVNGSRAVVLSKEPISEAGLKSQNENEPIAESEEKSHFENVPIVEDDLKSNNENEPIKESRVIWVNKVESNSLTMGCFKTDVELCVLQGNVSVPEENRLIAELSMSDDTRQVVSSPQEATKSLHPNLTYGSCLPHAPSADGVRERNAEDGDVVPGIPLKASCAGLEDDPLPNTTLRCEMGDVADNPTALDGFVSVVHEADPRGKRLDGCRGAVGADSENGARDPRLSAALVQTYAPKSWLSQKQILEGLSLSRRAFLSEIGLYHDVLVGAVTLSEDLLRVRDCEPCPYCVSKERDLASRDLAEISSAEASSMNNEPYQSCVGKRRRGDPSIQFCVIDDMTTNNTSMLDQSEISYISNGPHRGLLSRDSRWPHGVSGSRPAFVMPIDDSYNSYRSKVHMMRQTCWPAVTRSCRPMSFEYLKAHDPELSILISLLLLMLVQLICWTPLTALYIYYDVKGFPSKAKDQEISYLVLWCTRMALQPFIYAYYSTCFRQNIANLILCRFDR